MSNPQKEKRMKRIIRHRRVRSRMSGSPERPRLSVFRSHQWLSAQVIDDTRARTLLSIMEKKEKISGKPVERARGLGVLFAARCKEKGITSVVFDRGGYAYHGRVAAFAEGAREGGLQF